MLSHLNVLRPTVQIRLHGVVERNRISSLQSHGKALALLLLLLLLYTCVYHLYSLFGGNAAFVKVEYFDHLYLCLPFDGECS